jgi:cold shock CspA family protein
MCGTEGEAFGKWPPSSMEEDMKKARLWIVPVMAIIAVIMTFGRAWAESTVRVSVDSNGAQVNNGSTTPAVSQSGRYVTFQSTDGNLVADDTNGLTDIFVHDRDADEDGTYDEAADIATVRVNVKSDGSQASSGSSSEPAISDDGRFVVFQSNASNLVAGDTNGLTDIFVHDRDADEDGTYDEIADIATVRVSVTSAGAQASGGSSTEPAISGDGRFVVFQSIASNLVAGDTNGVTDIFVHDRDADEDGTYDETGDIATVRVSVKSDGSQASGGASSASTISDDGRFVVFQSVASNLVAGDTNGVTDVFVHDRDTDEDGIYDETENISTVRVSVKSDGSQAVSGTSTEAAISDDGRFVVFQSSDGGLVTGDTNGLTDVFVHDRDTDEDGIYDETGNISTVRVSVKSDGSQASGGISSGAAVSGNGRLVVFQANASNLVTSDTNGLTDVFVHDRDADEDGVYDEQGQSGAVATVRANVASDGTQASGGSTSAPAISETGRYAVFQSNAGNLVTGDTNGSGDIFVRDLEASTDGDTEEPTPSTSSASGGCFVGSAMSGLLGFFL